MSGKINHFFLSPKSPKLVRSVVHFANTLQAPWIQETVVEEAGVFEPQCHSEAMDLASCRAVGCKVARLVCTHGNFRVSRTIKRSLVDIGRTHYYVLIINYRQQDTLSTKENKTARISRIYNSKK
jgi:hypothetical protein